MPQSLHFYRTRQPSEVPWKRKTAWVALLTSRASQMCNRLARTPQGTFRHKLLFDRQHSVTPQKRVHLRLRGSKVFHRQDEHFQLHSPNILPAIFSKNLDRCAGSSFSYVTISLLPTLRSLSAV